MTDKGKIAGLATVTTRLVELMDAEVACIRKGLTRNLTGMQQEKMQLVAAYETALAELRREPDLFASIAPAVRDEIVAAMRRLDQAVERNLKAIAAARDVNRRLMASIVDAAGAERDRERGYGRNGAAGTSAAAAQEPLSVALDRRL